MRKDRTCAVLAGLGLLALAGCGGNDAPTAKDEAKAAAATGGWDATDACALLDKGALGTALNDPVTETSLGLVNAASGANAATSECTYRLQSGRTATLMARRSPIGDNSDAAIAQARSVTAKTVAAFTDKPVEDIAGLGKAAFFVPGINQLNVFLDEERFVILTIGSAPRESAKDIAVALAGKIKP